MQYAVEVESAQVEADKTVYYGVEAMTTELPYAAFAFVGKNTGRWRVKAKNELGESDWSEWRLFHFAR